MCDVKGKQQKWSTSCFTTVGVALAAYNGEACILILNFPFPFSLLFICQENIICYMATGWETVQLGSGIKGKLRMVGTFVPFCVFMDIGKIIILITYKLYDKCVDFDIHTER